MVPYRYVDVAGSDPLENPLRRELFEIVRTKPKITQKELQQACCIRSRSSVTHHLRVLEKLGYVIHHRTGRENTYETTYSRILVERPLNTIYSEDLPVE